MGDRIGSSLVLALFHAPVAILVLGLRDWTRRRWPMERDS